MTRITSKLVFKLVICFTVFILAWERDVIDHILVERTNNTRLHSLMIPQMFKAVPCEAKRHIMFTKTHKTGSSTVTTILQRYGHKNDLNFVLPPERHFFNEIATFNASFAFQYDLKDAKGNLVWPALGGFHILANHARYNRPEQDALIPDAFHFTILRNPVSQLESAFAFYRFGRHTPHHTLADIFKMDSKRFKVPAKPRLLRFLQNGQMFDLGMEQNSPDNQTVDGKIDALSHEMDLVMITEYFDESLVLLKKMLCWEFDDITYVSQLVRTPQSRRNVSSDLLGKIYKWNHADLKLYRHFNRTLWQKIDAYGPGFRADLEEFRAVNAAVSQQCLANATAGIHRSYPTQEFVLPKNVGEKCRDFLRDDEAWVPQIRNTMAQKSSAFLKNNVSTAKPLWKNMRRTRVS